MTDDDSAVLRIAMLNRCWKLNGEARARQAERLSDPSIDLVLLQEVDVRQIGRLAADAGFDWWECSLSPEIWDARLGVAVLGRSPVKVLARHQLPQAHFFNCDTVPVNSVYWDLGRWFHERHLALDVRTGGGETVRVGVMHATPAASRGPARQGVGDRKPWFHTFMAEWVSTWHSPFLFGIDANSPRSDPLERTLCHYQSAGEGQPGEDLLIGPPDVVVHRGVDLWRRWLDGPLGVTDRHAVPEGGPLAYSYFTNRWGWMRYDQIWASPDLTPVAMAYDYDPALSDHALVTVTVSCNG